MAARKSAAVRAGFGRGRAHEGHVVERSQEDAAIQGVEMEEALEFEVGGSGRFAAVARWLCWQNVYSARRRGE